MRKHFLGKDFESITEMDNLDTVAEEITVAETNDFFRHLRYCWRRHLTFLTQSSPVGGNFFIFPKISTFYIGYEGITEQGF